MYIQTLKGMPNLLRKKKTKKKRTTELVYKTLQINLRQHKPNQKPGVIKRWIADPALNVTNVLSRVLILNQ